MTLLICRTCPRYDSRRTGDFGRAMVKAITESAAGDGIAVRTLQCLGGCPEDGVVAVDGPGKARVRFNGLAVGDADAVVRAAAAHDACLSGAPDDWDIPTDLADRLSSVTFKRRSLPGRAPPAAARGRAS
jgi:predicted metal-binding protein